MPLAKLELIDSIQRLGLKYQFQKDIKQAVDVIHNKSADAWLSDDLHSTALRFRILREHGYTMSQDVFRRFTDEAGNFKNNLCEDVKGLLSLYEASFFSFKGEDIIDKARAFSTTHLKDAVKGDLISLDMARKVNHALDMPLHWKLARVEAKWYIDTYEQEQNMIPNLIKLAKLDYNIVQSVYQKEVSKLASNNWWVDIGLQKMTFARDRVLFYLLLAAFQHKVLSFFKGFLNQQGIFKCAKDQHNQAIIKKDIGLHVHVDDDLIEKTKEPRLVPETCILNRGTCTSVEDDLVATSLMHIISLVPSFNTFARHL